MNKLFIIGNLTRDPELTETKNGTKVCRFTVAVTRSYYSEGGERKTDYFNCSAWRMVGENVAKYCRKGSKVSVVGSVELRQYEDNKGNKLNSVDVLAQEVEFLSKSESRSREDADSAPASSKQTTKRPSLLEEFDDDGDIPF